MASYRFHLFVLAIIFAAALSVSSADGIKEEDSDPYKQIPSAAINPQEYGDGMSVATITASRMYKGQLENRTGEEGHLFFEKFPFVGLSKTYCVDRQVPDSACTSTAYMTGVKTNFKGIGITAKVQQTDCKGAKLEANRPSSIVQWAQEAGKATGVVTNTRITHASPAGAYAHISHRDFECDNDIVALKMDKTCTDDIARQLIEENPGKNIKVLLGGGRNKFLPKSNPNSTHGTGSRISKDLIAAWKQDKLNRKENAAYVTNIVELDKVNPENTDYLLGLFNPEHMEYHLDDAKEEPPLWKMTEKAIKILQKEKNGFFLFVEGGEIDMAHHEDQAKRALDETLEFDKAIETAAKLTDEQDTLIVVTADHAHTMTINGYPYRGNNILGLFGNSKDGLPYSTLSYANGLGYRKESFLGGRYNLDKDDTNNKDYRFPAMVPKKKETHGGEDVAVYARGPWAHLFTGNYEQNYIPIAEAYAAQIGPAATTKQDTRQDVKPNASSSVSISVNILSLLSCFLITLMVKFHKF
ncbi:alkaline phosphatase-like isoform X2 [Planococcus citri]|uniref:alkaline phosphatase-like isoform X2 n=1 Tax=Planococcus citri TaxID=170843 RepID=UPI0031F7614F